MNPSLFFKSICLNLLLLAALFVFLIKTKAKRHRDDIWRRRKIERARRKIKSRMYTIFFSINILHALPQRCLWVSLCILFCLHKKRNFRLLFQFKLLLRRFTSAFFSTRGALVIHNVNTRKHNICVREKLFSLRPSRHCKNHTFCIE